MPGPRVLFVKLSSLGDVVHHFPAVTDLARVLPQAHIAWAVEEAYADLVRLHPAVAQAIPVGLRRWRKHWLRPSSWREMRETRRGVGREPWDYIVDTQGLVKSAAVARWGRGPRFGADRASARERVAARGYDVALPVPRAMHAVERNRLLVSQVFGYALSPGVDYGLRRPDARPTWAPQGAYVVLLQAASHVRKRWPEARWIELGQRLAAHGVDTVIPGGTQAEREAASRMAAAIPGAISAPSMGLAEAAALLAHARAACGVDTGLTHLAAALDVPTVGLYVATRPELTGLHAHNVINLEGGAGGPGVEQVTEALLPALSP